MSSLGAKKVHLCPVSISFRVTMQYRMMPFMSTGGGGDQVKKRVVGFWETPFTDCGGDDGTAR